MLRFKGQVVPITLWTSKITVCVCQQVTESKRGARVHIDHIEIVCAPRDLLEHRSCSTPRRPTAHICHACHNQNEYERITRFGTPIAVQGLSWYIVPRFWLVFLSL
jgi:hypothetical protein